MGDSGAGNDRWQADLLDFTSDGGPGNGGYHLVYRCQSGDVATRGTFACSGSPRPALRGGKRSACCAAGGAVADARALRLIARRTWRFFETFVIATTHAAPDNFQEDPKPVVAHRTSYQYRLYLCPSSRPRLRMDRHANAVERLEATFATMRRPRDSAALLQLVR